LRRLHVDVALRLQKGRPPLRDVATIAAKP